MKVAKWGAKIKYEENKTFFDGAEMEDGSKLSVGDYVLLESGKERKYVGCLAALMRDDMGDPLCRVIWFFSSDELDTRIRPPVVPVPNEVFVGLEWDDNSLGAVLRTVLVLPFKDRERKGNSRFTYFYRYSISSKIFSPCFGIKLNRTAGTLELLENPTEPPMRDALDSLGSILKIKKPLGTTIIKEDVSQEITANSEIVASQLRQASHRESFPTHNTQTLG
eukprot:TRINITY_DN5441_c0_g1_i1.p1 TRINITY_DN5441_c0_g1~~TRINITY_DN5441_c0_g1_i1.p1  ORF type:complete len:222 (-),score=29.36 TRINITY_DN5441_c0_g1_i1:829-1494(-)